MKNMLFLLISFFSVFSFSQDVFLIEVTQNNPSELEFRALVEMFSVTEVLSEVVTVSENNITIDICYFATILQKHDTKQHILNIPISEDFSNYNLNFRIYVEFEDNPIGDCSTIDPSYDENFEINTPVTGTISLGLNENGYQQKIRIYPNPVRDIFFIDVSNAMVLEEILLFDINGNLLRNFRNSLNYSIESVPSGLYFLKIGGERKSHFIKIVKL